MQFARWFVALLGVVAVVGVPAALADKPIMFPLPGPSGQLPDIFCGFPVDFTTLQGKEHGKIFSNGIFAVEGTLKLRLTNALTGKSIDVNASGPARFIPQSDGTTVAKLQGTGVGFFAPGELGPGASGALLLSHGLVTERLDANGFVIPGTVKFSGKSVDLCAALS